MMIWEECGRSGDFIAQCIISQSYERHIYLHFNDRAFPLVGDVVVRGGRRFIGGAWVGNAGTSDAGKGFYVRSLGGGSKCR